LNILGRLDGIHGGNPKFIQTNDAQTKIFHDPRLGAKTGIVTKDPQTDEPEDICSKEVDKPIFKLLR